MNELKSAATSVKELESAINEALKVLKENTGFIVYDIEPITSGYIHDMTQKVLHVKLKIRT